MHGLDEYLGKCPFCFIHFEDARKGFVKLVFGKKAE